MLCEKCGCEINSHASFCLHCGAKIDHSATPTYPTRPVEPVAPVTPAGTVLQDFSEGSGDDIVTTVLQADAYKTARRKLILRIGSIALFLILSLISSFGNLEHFLLLYLPFSFWCSLFVTFLLGDGIRGMFKKIGNAIAGVLAWILAFFVYGILLVIALAVVAIVISMIFESLPTTLLAIVLGVAWYSGVVLSAVFGIRNYLEMNQYKHSYEQARNMLK